MTFINQLFLVLFGLLLFSCNTEHVKYDNAPNENDVSETQDSLGKIEPAAENHEVRIVEGDTINKVDEAGMLQGEWERLYPDGSWKCRGVYKDGRKEGYWERKYSNGNFRYQINTHNGLLSGYCKFYYENGNLKKEGSYIESKPEGKLKIYNENGTILSEETYIDGKLSGHCSYYDENGVLKHEGTIINELREDVWKFYDDGIQEYTITYKEGKVLSLENTL